jgi:hypothetical protein
MCVEKAGSAMLCGISLTVITQYWLLPVFCCCAVCGWWQYLQSDLPEHGGKFARARLHAWCLLYAILKNDVPACRTRWVVVWMGESSVFLDVHIANHGGSA